MKPATISIYVKDLKEATTFYRDIIGFQVNKELPFLVILGSDGQDIVLCPAEKSASVDYPNSSAVVLGFGTDNLQNRIAELEANKVDMIFATPQDFPGGKFIAVRDPSGNVVEFLEFSAQE